MTDARLLNLTVVEVDGRESPLAFPLRRAFNAGWAGRDLAEVEAHIAELQEVGVPRPARVPECFEISIDRLAAEDTSVVQVMSPDTSGEVEYALWVLGDEVFAGVASDHTDRGLEAFSVPFSKQVYPNVVSTRVWRLADLLPRWDEIVLRSWLHDAEGAHLYQDGTVGQLLEPGFWLDRLSDSGVTSGADGGVVVLSGTINAIGAVRASTGFSVQMTDPATGRELGFGYKVSQLLETIC